METVAYLLFWALLFMFMMRFGCGAHVMGHRHHGHHSESGGGSDRLSQPAQAVDPVCGMTVATAGAKSTIFEGRAWYFCSASCRDKFEAAPQQYAKADAAHSTGEPHHAA
ncbi:YHS domain-containing protein [Sphingopyxis sp. GW247-27LB]|uniref:YHS domain-containing protein n=1 Tax=Sphingopyxis sp. GW247-27LB TaxID=2012632 RepID=UPI000BA76792|nr:YHS domain-containing protein [Sphingopyxis sp. GW247-27LB]PAL19766.1 cation transporter [Sphingopyxis sp. GW247-27LB]